MKYLFIFVHLIIVSIINARPRYAEPQENAGVEYSYPPQGQPININPPEYSMPPQGIPVNIDAPP